jgi:hypothetical protein
LVRTGGRAKIGEVDVIGTPESFVMEFTAHGALEILNFTEHEATRLKNELQEWLNRNLPVKVAAPS